MNSPKIYARFNLFDGRQGHLFSLTQYIVPYIAWALSPTKVPRVRKSLTLGPWLVICRLLLPLGNGFYPTFPAKNAAFQHGNIAHAFAISYSVFKKYTSRIKKNSLDYI